MPLPGKPTQQHGQRQPQRHRPQIPQQGQRHVCKLYMACLQRVHHGGTNAEGGQGHRVVQSGHLQKQVDERSFGAVLPDRHDGGGRGRGAADGAQQQCKRHGQAEYEDHRQRDGHGGTQRLGQCDSQHLSAGTLQIRDTEIPSGGKRDIGEREIGDEFHAAGQPCGDQVQCIRSHQDTCQNIARHVG